MILGILATVAVFAVTGMTNKGKTSACKADLKILQTAEEAYNANNVDAGVYGDQADLKAAGLIHEVSPNFTVVVGPGTGYGRQLHHHRQPRRLRRHQRLIMAGGSSCAARGASPSSSCSAWRTAAFTGIT